MTKNDAADDVRELSTAITGQLGSQAETLEGEIADLSTNVAAAMEAQATVDSDARAALSTEIRSTLNGQDGAAGSGPGPGEEEHIRSGAAAPQRDCPYKHPLSLTPKETLTSKLPL